MSLLRRALMLIVAATVGGSIHAEPSANAGSMAPLRIESAAPVGVAVAQHAVAQFSVPVRRNETGTRRTPEFTLLPVDAVPEPTGWTTLFSAILAMIFIARRKSSSDTD